jgi:hypothetical protein
VLLLLLAAFFARGFSQELGDAHVGGRYALLPLFQSRQLNTLTLSWNGMSLHFSRWSSPALRGIESGEAGTSIVFAGDVRLHLAADAGTAGSLALTAAAPSASGAALSIPFTIAGVPVEPAADAALSWKREGKMFLLSLPAGGQADMEARVLTLPLGPRAGTATLRVAGAAIASAPARVSPVRAAAKAAVPDEKSLPTSEQLTAALGRFLDAAYLGWTQDRYSPATGQWKLADGSAGFSGDIGVPLFAEAVARGTWQAVLPLWSGAEPRRGAEAAGPRAAYIGGVRDYVHALSARQASAAERVRGLLANPDISLLGVPGLMPLLMEDGSTENAKAVATYLASVNAKSLDVPSSLSLLEDLLDYGEAAAASETVTRALRALVSTRILPSVSAAETAVFLVTGTAGRCDLGAGVRCGSLLLRAGALLKDTLVAAVGRGLLRSALDLADPSGMLPAALTVSSGRVSARERTIAPESLYALLPLDRRLPRRVPASAAFGTGAWVWTAARVVSVEGSAEGARVLFSYPQGIPYHLAIVGVKPFRQMKLHGIAWHADPDYAKYSDGWAYEAATRTLFMKITGRGEQEEITLSY